MIKKISKRPKLVKIISQKFPTPKKIFNGRKRLFAHSHNLSNQEKRKEMGTTATAKNNNVGTKDCFRNLKC